MRILEVSLNDFVNFLLEGYAIGPSARVWKTLSKQDREFLSNLAQVAADYNVIRLNYGPKLTTGRYVSRTIEPYSLRFRKLRIGKVPVLFGFDVVKGHIKMFPIYRIHSFEYRGRKFEPRWPVEFKKD